MDFWEWLQSITRRSSRGEAQQPLARVLPAQTRRSWNEELSTSMARAPVIPFNGSLKNAIWAALSGTTNEIAPSQLGGRESPVVLPTVIVEAERQPGGRFDSPFSDTLNILIEGEERIPIRQVEDYQTPHYGPAQAVYFPERFLREDMIGIPEGAGDRSLPHEFGHAFDYRRVNPQLAGEVRSYYPNALRNASGLGNGEPWGSGENNYRLVNDSEFFASAFSEAISTLRYPPASEELTHQLSYFQRERPETLVILKYLVDNPLYSSHPLAEIIRSTNIPPPSLPTMRVQGHDN